jgi:hypothetical protein
MINSGPTGYWAGMISVVRRLPAGTYSAQVGMGVSSSCWNYFAYAPNTWPHLIITVYPH